MVFSMLRSCLLAAWTAFLWAAAPGSLQVQHLLRIPAQRGQQVSSLRTDSQGNLIVAAFVAVPDTTASYSYTAIKKIDASGVESFSRVLPFAGRVALGVDSHDDIYIAGA